MSKTIKLSIITPGKAPITEEIISLITESSDGKVEFMRNHCPIIISTIPTISIIKKANGSEEKVFTSTGIISINDNTINFCTDVINFKDEIDVNRAKEAKVRAEKRLAKRDKIDVSRAERALARAKARIQLFED